MPPKKSITKKDNLELEVKEVVIKKSPKKSFQHQ